MGYSGDRIVCAQRDKHIDTVTDYHELEPQEVGPLDAAMAQGMPLHKLIVMADPAEIDDARPQLAAVLGSEATLVQAM